jgi:hypothetical protein
MNRQMMSIEKLLWNRKIVGSVNNILCKYENDPKYVLFLNFSFHTHQLILVNFLHQKKDQRKTWLLLITNYLPTRWHYREKVTMFKSAFYLKLNGLVRRIVQGTASQEMMVEQMH